MCIRDRHSEANTLLPASAPDRSLLRPDTSFALCSNAQRAAKEKEAIVGTYASLAKSPQAFAEGCGHSVVTPVELFQNAWRHFLYASCAMWNEVVDGSRSESFQRLGPMDCEKQAEWLRFSHKEAGFTQSELTVEEMLAGCYDQDTSHATPPVTLQGPKIARAVYFSDSTFNGKNKTNTKTPFGEMLNDHQ